MVQKRSSNQTNKVREEFPVHGQKPQNPYAKNGSEWRELAACIGADPRLFDLDGRDDLDITGTLELRHTNEEKFAKAWKYCDGCEVKTACRIDSYAYGDNEVTVRGGMNPYDVKPREVRSHVRRNPKAVDFEAGWVAFVKGLSTRDIRRATGGPASGPWPDWVDFVRTKLPELSQVAWDAPGEASRFGWQLKNALKYDRTVYIVMERSPDRFSRHAAPIGEVRVVG